MIGKKVLTAIALVSILASSCVDESRDSGKRQKEIRASVTTEDGATVKSGDESWSICEDIDLSVADMQLTFSAVASYNSYDPFVSVPQTKGTILTTDNIATIKKFDLYIPDAETLQQVTMSVNDGKWAIDPQGGKKAEWPAAKEGQDIDFYAYTGGQLASLSTPTKLSYTSNSTIASEQKDLLYAHVKAKKNDVPIHFYHALAAVRFVVGDLKPVYEVKSITLKNIADRGVAEHKGGDSFVWSLGSNRTSFSQNFSSSTHTAKAFFDNEVSSTFFVVPQRVAGVKFEVMISDGVNEYPLEMAVPALDGGWKAGFFYTYSISGGEGKVNVEVVEGEFMNGVSTTKTKVAARNTGKLISYVRAAVVGNWYNDNHKIVAPWDGTITPASGSGWYAGSDGFYYYTKPVQREVNTAVLLESYTAPESPVPGAHLELNVIVQAVEYDAAKDNVGLAWPAESGKLEIIKK